MIDAMKRCLGKFEQMGAAAIVLDVLEAEDFERRLQFYADLGFRSLNDHEDLKRVYIQVVDVSSTIGWSLCSIINEASSLAGFKQRSIC